jgi:hypothetical protein
MRKPIFIAALFTVSAISQVALAGPGGVQIYAPACLAPMDPAHPNPQPRDVHITRNVDQSSGRTLITASACLVSNLSRIADSSVQFALFDPTGAYIPGSGLQVGPLSATVGSTPPQPNIIAQAASTFWLPSGYTGPLSPLAWIEVQWVECSSSSGGTCERGAVHTDTFLREFTLDQRVTARRRR